MKIFVGSTFFLLFVQVILCKQEVMMEEEVHSHHLATRFIGAIIGASLGILASLASSLTTNLASALSASFESNQG